MNRETLIERLGELGLSLPTAPAAVAAYVPAVCAGGMVYVSGQLPMREGNPIAKGPVPSVISLEKARDAARQAALNGLAAIDQAIEGQWERLERLARVGVFVLSDHEFTEQHLVANGASELLFAALGDVGRHARAAVGVSALPLGVSVEVELLAVVRDA